MQYRQIGLGDLADGRVRDRYGRSVARSTPLLPAATLAVPPVGFGQTAPPDFPVAENPAGHWGAHALAAPAVACWRLRHAVVRTALGIVTIDGQVLRETLAHIPFDRYGFVRAGDALTMPDAPVHRARGKAAHLLGGFNAPRNWFHWVYDVLARLFVDQYADAALLWPGPVGAFQSGTLDLLPELAARSRLVADGDHLSFDELIYVPDTMTRGFLPHPAIRPVFDALRARVRPSPVRRLYVTRQDSTNRRLVNEDAVIALVKRHGFHPVALGALPVAEQIALFAGATHVIGAHGAGLANLAFCAPGAAVCELHADFYLPWFFRRLAAQAGLRYGCVVGRLHGPRHPTWNHANAWQLDPEVLKPVFDDPAFIQDPPG